MPSADIMLVGEKKVFAKKTKDKAQKGQKCNRKKQLMQKSLTNIMKE